MNLDVLHIILIISCIVFLTTLIIILIRLKNTNKIYNAKKYRLINKYNNLLKNKDKEIERHKVIINNIKSKNSNYKITETKHNNYNKSNIQENVVNLTSEKVQLLEEKKQIAEKNKKLWDMGIVIHKEKEKIAELKKDIEKRHNVVTNSIQYAKRIQNALLVPDNLLKNWFNDYFIFWKPRDIVSGDFYWAKKTDNYIVFCVADCTGHGVPGAFMSMLGIAYLNDFVNNTEVLDASAILEKLRIQVISSLRQRDDNSQQKDGMDMALCILDTQTNNLQFSGANNPIYIINNNKFDEIKGLKNPIGIYLNEKPFFNTNLNLKKNDMIYLFSDGFVDQFGGKKGRKYTSGKFKKLLEKYNKENLSTTEQKKQLDHEYHNWVGEKYKQIDDILIMGIRIQ